MISLRPYQIEAKNAVLKEWSEGNRKTLLVLPTGTGKTVVFSSVIAETVAQGGRVLILAHRGELLEQAKNKLKEVCGIDAVLEKAGSTGIGSNIPVTVGSIQTMSQQKRLALFPKNYFDAIIVDEAHHCLSGSYQRVLKHFSYAKILGVTATPDRSDKRNLGKYFDSTAYEYSMRKAIEDGNLCPIKAQFIPLKLDIASVRIYSGDYAAGEIGNVLEPCLEQIAREMVPICKGRKTTVFLPLVSTSQKFCAILNRYGLRAVEINGNSEDRAGILKRFESGEYDVLCNSMLLTEGWDCPAVDCIVILRPTRSRALYQQMVGRGMRLSSGKDHLLLLDFLWMTGRHDLCRPSDLICGDKELARKIDREIWQNDDAYDLIEAEGQVKRNAQAEREAALARELAEKRRRDSKLVDPIQYALSINEEDLLDYEPAFPWEMVPPTQAQLAYLEKLGICTDSVKTKGMASLLIDRVKRRREEGLATPKQIHTLESFEFRNVGMWSFEEAGSMISRIAANNWRMPSDVNPAHYNPRNNRNCAA